MTSIISLNEGGYISTGTKTPHKYVKGMVMKMPTVVRVWGSRTETPTTIPAEVKKRARPMVNSMRAEREMAKPGRSSQTGRRKQRTAKKATTMPVRRYPATASRGFMGAVMVRSSR